MQFILFYCISGVDLSPALPTQLFIVTEFPKWIFLFSFSYITTVKNSPSPFWMLISFCTLFPLLGGVFGF